MNGLDKEKEDISIRSGRVLLAKVIAQYASNKNRLDTPIQGLTLHRWETPTEPTSYMLGPSICLIGQGRKQVVVGEESYIYDATNYLVTTVDLPVVAQIIEASSDKPYLGLTLELDLRVIAQFILGLEKVPSRPQQDRLGIAVSKVTGPLLDAFHRLIALLGQPDDIFALAPLIKQEIIYRLLMGEQGQRLRQFSSVESQSYQIARAVDWIKANFDKPFRVEDLAKKAGLSSSAFHNHFRSMTAMSPLQYQKKMRLSEARRLMFTEHMDASTAAFEVGYESPSQFSREYNRLFGAPPLRDIAKLRETEDAAIS